MEKYRIYNAVPAYEIITSAAELIKKNPSILLDDMLSNKAEEYKIILPKGQKELLEQILTDAEKNGFLIQIIEADVTSGFVFQNQSALQQMALGEKPIPTSAQTYENVVQIFDLAQEKLRYVELPNGTIKTIRQQNNQTYKEIIETSGCKDSVKAIYLGYPSGHIIAESEFDQRAEEKIEYVKLIADTQCMLDELAKIAFVYRRQTCGKCVFGHEGSAQIQLILTDMTQKKGKSSDLNLLLELCTIMQSQTLCEIGSSLALTVQDAIQKYREEIEAHITRKNCQAGVCSKFVTYHIMADQCTGCTECMDACEEDAIQGKKRFVHVILQDECTQCGACMDACEEEAIVKAGAVKPRCPMRPIPCKNR